MITCREIAFGTRRNSADGEPTKNPPIVRTPSLKLFVLKSWRKFFHRDDETYLFVFILIPTLPPLPSGVIVWLWSFPRWPLFFGNMTQVDADACPCR